MKLPVQRTRDKVEESSLTSENTGEVFTALCSGKIAKQENEGTRMFIFTFRKLGNLKVLLFLIEISEIRGAKIFKYTLECCSSFSGYFLSTPGSSKLCC